jgi:hypothetical protein
VWRVLTLELAPSLQHHLGHFHDLSRISVTRVIAGTYFSMLALGALMRNAFSFVIVCVEFY